MRTLFLAFVMTTALATYAQVFTSTSYQGVARDVNGDPIANQAISLQFEITFGLAMAYREINSATTNDHGVFSVAIGTGTPAGGQFATYNDIEWYNSSLYTLRVFVDFTGGTNYQFLGSQSLTGVPLANLSREAQTLVNGAIDAQPYGLTPTLWTGSAFSFGIRTPSPNVALDVNGDIQYTGTITDVSDRRLKENIEQIDGAVADLQQLQGYTYTMKDDEEGRREHGVMAQDVQQVFPEMVSRIDDDTDHLGVSYIQLIPVLLEAIKELNEENIQLRAQNELLQDQHDQQAKAISNNSQTLQKLQHLLLEP